MKKTIVFIVLICSLLFCTACSPNLKGVEQIKLDVEELIYEKSTDWDHAQGLCADERYFYFAGHNDKTNENADIHIIDRATLKDVKVLGRAGAMHSAELYADPLRGTLFTCSGGDGRKPFVFEIDKTDGKLLNRWDFDELGEKGGGAIARCGENEMILFTSSKNGARIAFSRVLLKENGEFEVISEHFFSETDLGVPQGLAWHDGYVYLLTDAGVTVNDNPHYIYKIELCADKRIKICTAYKFSMKRQETEGLHIDEDGCVYIGSCHEKLYRFKKPLAEW